MNYTSKTELERLVYALCDDSITDPEHQQLQRILSGDAEARLHYIKTLELHNLLDLECENHAASSSVVPIDKYLAKQKRKTAIRASAAAALILIALGVSMRMMMISPDPINRATVKVSPHSEFKIIHRNQELSKANDLFSGSSLELHQGTVELQLSSGVEAIVQAPASLTLTDSSHIDLRSGVVWFNVPSQAVGFEVTTPDMRVVDLGTEFGVSVDFRNIDRDTVHVLKGSVEITTLFGEESHEVLTAGEARKVHFSGRLTEIPVSEASYLKSLPDSLPYMHWSFDEKVAGGFPAVGTEPLAEKIQSTERQTKLNTVAGKLGQAAVFNKIGGLVTDWPGIDADRPRTVSCWVKSSDQNPIGAIVGWGVPAVDASKWRVTLNPERENEGGVRGALRTEFGYGYIIGTTDLRDGKWHYITSVYDGSGIGNAETIKLYVDGKPEAISVAVENYIDTIIDDERSAPLAIGYNFKGEIDELHIYQGVLPEKAILEEFQSQSNQP